MDEKELCKDIEYLRGVLGNEYLVNEDWLVNFAYENLVNGSIDLKDFLLSAIKDIFSEVECNTYNAISDESIERFNKDLRVREISEKYNIDMNS